MRFFPMNRLIFLISFIVLSFCSAYSQDTLPNFAVKNIGNNNIIISWQNNFDLLKQISIQTSHDSLSNYRTLLTLTDPNSKENGYHDANAINDHMYYRLFIVKGNGEFFFSAAKQPVIDSFETASGISKKRFNNRTDFIPSFYVYTNQDGFVYLNLPDAERKKYRLKFFEEDNSLLFEIKNIKESGLTLDKSNFLHAGWFRFELYNDDKLVEKNRIYLEKEF
jgi:hypothetical protein